MLSIIIFRHGKSDWDAIYDKDHNRPLSKRGIKAAKKMGNYLKQINQIPDVVISSSAIRAKNTAELAMNSGEWKSIFYIEPRIYGGSSEEFLNKIFQKIKDIKK